MAAPTPPGGLTSDNPFKSGAEQSPFFWRGIANTHQAKLNKKAAEQPQDELGSKGLRDNVEKPRKSKTGGSLVTGNDKPRRKKIYGMGGSQGKEKSGTVKKPTLGGE